MGLPLLMTMTDPMPNLFIFCTAACTESSGFTVLMFLAIMSRTMINPLIRITQLNWERGTILTFMDRSGYHCLISMDRPLLSRNSPRQLSPKLMGSLLMVTPLSLRYAMAFGMSSTVMAIIL